MLEIQVKNQINKRNVLVIDDIKETSRNNKINKIKNMNTNNIETVSKK